MSKLVAYLKFRGNCEEAMNFYKNALGGSLDIKYLKDSPMSDPNAPANAVMHSTLTNGVLELFGSDMADESEANIGTNYSLCVICDSEEQAKSVYEKLSEGGNQNHPMKEEFFGWFGDLTDKYKINWMVQFSPARQQES